VLGVDALVLGSDRPYAEPLPTAGLGAAVHHAIRVANPARLLHGDPPPPGPLPHDVRLPQNAGV
jgi:hypothetical protein